MAIRWDKFTVKAQEAVQRANEFASEHGNPELQPIASARSSARGQGRHCSAGARENRHRAAGCPERGLSTRSRSCPKFRDEAAQATLLATKSTSCLSRLSKKPTISRTNTSLPSICCWPSPISNAIRRSKFSRRQAPRYDAILKALTVGPRIAESYRPESGSEVSGAGALCSRPDGTGASRQARSCHRTR